MNILNHNRSSLGRYTIQRRTRQGRPHIVVPVVMMVEGVHRGSQGAILHIAENLSNNVSSWNGIPITDGHPQINGVYISANNPEINVIGHVYNTRFEDSKLKAEAWLDEESIKEFSPLALAYINQSRALDVSVGVYSETLNEEGDWNGESYVGISINYRPDHLALLPGEVGACSWDDGCGIRINKSSNMKTKEQKERHDLQINLLASLNNHSGYMELLNKIRRKVDELDNDHSINFLHDVYDSYFIYRKETYGGDTEYYKQEYSVSESEGINIVGVPVKVVMEFKEIQNQNKKPIINQKEKGELIMSKAKNCCPEKIEALITNEVTRFEESDREWLGELPPENLSKLEPKVVRTTPAITDEAVKNYIASKKREDIISLLPEELQANVNSAFETIQKIRDEKIEQITTNSEEWKKEDLEVLSDEVLDKISKTVNVKKEELADYSASRGGGTPSNEKGGTLLPFGVK